MSVAVATGAAPCDGRADMDGTLQAVLARHDPERIVEVVAPYLTETRRARIDAVVAARIDSVQVAIEAPSDPHNASAVVRTAEALGALTVHVVAAEGRALHAKAVTQGSFHWVQTRAHQDLEAFLAQMRAQDPPRRLYGAAMDGAVPLARLRTDVPMCLVFGNETRGLSDAARRACDALFHVPMVGMSESLNLSVTAAISLHQVLSDKRAAGTRCDLDPPAAARLRARYYARSVDPRLLAGLFAREETA